MKIDKAYIRISEGVTGKVLITICSEIAHQKTKIAISPVEAKMLAEDIMNACRRIESRS